MSLGMADEDLHPEPDLPYDASDPAEVAKAQDRAVRREARKRVALAKFLADSGGRDWMWDLMASANMFDNQFVPGQADSTAFKLGEANVGKRILAAWLSVSPETYIKIQRARTKGNV